MASLRIAKLVKLLTKHHSSKSGPYTILNLLTASAKQIKKVLKKLNIEFPVGMHGYPPMPFTKDQEDLINAELLKYSLNKITRQFITLEPKMIKRAIKALETSELGIPKRIPETYSYYFKENEEYIMFIFYYLLFRIKNPTELEIMRESIYDNFRKDLMDMINAVLKLKTKSLEISKVQIDFLRANYVGLSIYFEKSYSNYEIEHKFDLDSIITMITYLYMFSIEEIYLTNISYFNLIIITLKHALMYFS
jgi:hypothetical protein